MPTHTGTAYVRTRSKLAYFVGNLVFENLQGELGHLRLGSDRWQHEHRLAMRASVVLGTVDAD